MLYFMCLAPVINLFLSSRTVILYTFYFQTVKNVTKQKFHISFECILLYIILGFRLSGPSDTYY
jgi:hypothetical protein